jgi:hypothetical protein
MILIPLVGIGEGRFAQIDEDDAEIIRPHRWRLLAPRRALTCYAITLINKQTTLMHRLVMSPPAHLFIDHIDGDGLNNQKVNLRCVTPAENARYGLSRRAFDRYESEL